MLLKKHKNLTIPLIFMNSIEIEKNPIIILSSENYRRISEKYRKKFLRDCVDLALLYLLENHGSLHGYELMKTLKGKFGSNPGTSTVYPALWYLEREGCVNSKITIYNQRLRRVYSITPKGKWFLQAGRNELKIFLKKLEKGSAIKRWFKRYLTHID